MSSSPQRSKVSTSPANLRDLLAITNAVKAEFWIERIIALTVVTASLLFGLYTAVVAVARGNWQGSTAIVFGSGGVCTAGVSALFYMYNRSLVFMERMAGVQAGGNARE